MPTKNTKKKGAVHRNKNMKKEEDNGCVVACAGCECVYMDVVARGIRA
jgi:hypothetical protein